MSHPAPPIPESYWVVPGRLAAGEYPGAKEATDARVKLRQFVNAGVTFFVDLTQARELEPHAALLQEEARAMGRPAEHVRLPIRDQGVPSPSRMTEILDAIDAALAEGNVVYVHCWGGHGRTGTVVGCYLVRHGMSGHEALAEVARLHATTPDHNRPSPDTGDQCKMVLHWERSDDFSRSAYKSD